MYFILQVTPELLVRRETRANLVLLEPLVTQDKRVKLVRQVRQEPQVHKVTLETLVQLD